jgi:hypothetical protein
MSEEMSLPASMTRDALVAMRDALRRLVSETSDDSATLPVIVMAVVAVALAAACGESGGAGHGDARPGAALNKPFVSMTTESVPFPVGQEWDHTEVDIVNTSHKPITLRRLVIVGSGIGRVARVLGNWAAPLGTVKTTVPSALYHRFPPAFALPHHAGCAVQTLRAVRGFTLAAGRTMRFLTLLRAVSPGRFHSTGVDAYYTQAGTLYHQLIPIGFTATVKAGAAPFPLEPWEHACADTETRLLPPLSSTS